jgi:hypothetical protein
VPDIVFETDRFNLSEVRPHFINPCCFGEDLAAWLRGKLAERGIKAHEPAQEDWGWYTGVSFGGGEYFIAIGGNAEEGAANRGEWRIAVEKVRTLWEKLTGKNKMLPQDGLVALILSMVSAEPAFGSVRLEQD